MRITDTFLRKHWACPDQRKLFRKLYPRGANTTAATLGRAARAGLSISWLGRFIPAPARKAYRKATAPAEKAYQEAIATARKAYHEAIATALAKALRGVK